MCSIDTTWFNTGWTDRLRTEMEQIELGRRVVQHLISENRPHYFHRIGLP